MTVKPCKHLGCPLLTEDEYCEFHVRLYVHDAASIQVIEADRAEKSVNDDFSAETTSI
jgi:hypothetical protein